ncbi:MAG: ribosomal RNA small subunit methyltransferase A [Clostridia bacterium]|nr:ribosomal RNA small subunit methyltransferase A [Clostridia bacterium]
MSKFESKSNTKFEGHQFKKSLGQNFISDTNLLNAIGEDSGVTQDDIVIEVGAGAGTLTDIIAKRCKKMVSFEVDETLRERLADVELKNDNLQVIFKDIMEVDLINLPQILGVDNNNFSYKVVANLPYYITTPIIFKFLQDSIHLESLTIMVQKEVGERIIAKPKTSEYGALSATVAFYGSARIARIVKKQNFYPMPKVDSCIVRIDIERAKFANISEDSYKKMVRTAFNNRRKTLVHNLTHELGLNKDTVLNSFKELGISEKVRGEELSAEQFAELVKVLRI